MTTAHTPFIRPWITGLTLIIFCLLWAGSARAQSTGSFVIASGTINLTVPDGNASGVSKTLQNNSGAPNGAVVMELHYRLRIDNDADPSQQPRPDDYRIKIESAESGAANALTVYDKLGGSKDRGHDDDPEDDRDIELDWRSTSFFNGENPNQVWTLKVADLDDSSDIGDIEFVDFKIFWRIPGQGDPEIRSSPTALTVDLSSQASVVSKTGKTGKTTTSTKPTSASTQAKAPDFSDPDTDIGDVLGTELVIRFNAASASKLHAHSLDSSAKKTKAAGAAAMMKASGIPDINALPAEIEGITGFTSGKRKASKAIAKDKSAKALVGKAGAFSKAGKASVAKAVQKSHQAGNPVGMFKAKVKKGTDLRKLITELNQRADVVYAEPIPMSYPMSAPNDPLLGDMWNITMLNMTSAWSHAANSPGGVKVAVVDTGVRLDHIELAGRLVSPTDVEPSNGDAYANSDPEDDDPDGHGTQCAGIIAAIRDNGIGLPGIAPVFIIPINATLVVDGGISFPNYPDGIMQAVDLGADVISCSFGGVRSNPFQSEIDAIAYAESNGVIVVASSGNSDTTADNVFPAAMDYVISVGAVDDQKRRVDPSDGAPFGSNFGLTLDLCAPGYGDVDGPTESSVSIITLDNGNSGDTRKGFRGTSAAAPHVAGVCALLKHINPSLTAAEIRNIVETTAADQVGDPTEDVAGRDNHHGHGLIDAAAAVSMARTNAVTSIITVFNEGDDVLNVSSVNVTGGNWLEVSPAGATTVMPGKTLELLAVVDRSLAGNSASATIVVNSDDSDEATLNIPVSAGTSGFSPVIDSRSPDSDNVHVLTNNNVILSVSVSDPDGDSLTYAWFFDNQLVPNENTGSYGFGTSSAFLGTHSTRVEISDGTHTLSNEWSVVIGQGDPDLVGYWSFENGSGNDLSGHGHDLTVQGNVDTTVNGIKGQALKFSGE